MKFCFFSLVSLMMVPWLNSQPISLHPENPHYFLYHGKPLALISSAEHYGAVINPDFDYIKYLNTLQKDGMNYTRIFSGTYFEEHGSFGIEKNTLSPLPGRALIPWKRSDVPGAACGGNRFDLDQFDETYFARLKSFFAEAEKRGIIVELTLFTSIYGHWKIQPLNPANNICITDTNLSKENLHTLNNGPALKYQESLVRKIIKELNGFDNLIYEIQNEPYVDHRENVTLKDEHLDSKDLAIVKDEKWRNAIKIADQSSIGWQKRIAEIIAYEESALKNRHLVAQNLAEHAYPVTDPGKEISVMNFHYALPLMVRLNYHHNKALGLDETGFSGSDDITYRKQAWRFIIAGGGLFNNLDYSFTVGNEDGTGVNKAPGGGSPELRKQLRILSDLFHSLDFIRMKPDYVVSALEDGLPVQALSEPGKQYIVYCGSGTSCNIKLSMPGGKYNIQWISTLNGDILKTELKKHKSGEIVLQSPEYRDDIALKIIRKQ